MTDYVIRKAVKEDSAEIMALIKVSGMKMVALYGTTMSTCKASVVYENIVDICFFYPHYLYCLWNKPFLLVYGSLN